MLFSTGSLVLGILTLPDATTLELAVYFGGGVIFAGISIALGIDIATE